MFDCNVDMNIINKPENLYGVNHRGSLSTTTINSQAFLFGELDMKICWDNIDELFLTRSGNLRGKGKFYYFRMCEYCKEEFLSFGKDFKFCDIICSGKAHSGKNNPMYGKKSLGHTGKKHSLEFKLAMKGNKRGEGYKHTKETLIKISGKNHPMYGKHHTEKARKKISQSLIGNKYTLGRKYTDEERISCSIRSLGESNSNWKGGISNDPYCGAWHDQEYKTNIKDRDNFKCQNFDCWGFIGPLSIHHIDYDKQNCNPDNLISVCRSCNSRANGNLEKYLSTNNEGKK